MIPYKNGDPKEPCILVYFTDFYWELVFFLSLCFCVYLSVCLYLCLSFCHCFRLCLSLCLFVSICLPACLSVCLSVCLSLCVSVCLSVCLSACLSVFLSVNKSNHKCCSIKKVVLKNFAIFTGKYLCWSLSFWNNFIKMRLQHRCFSMNIAKLLKTAILKSICERLFFKKVLEFLQIKKCS